MPLADPGVLRRIPLFELFDSEEIASLAQHLDEVRYLAGQQVLTDGDAGGTMFIVTAGRVELYLKNVAGERVQLGVVEPGELFGELSLLDNQPRSANARAIDNTELIVIDRDDLQKLITAHPAAALDMMAILGKRMREANLQLHERVARNVNEVIPPASSLGERLSDFLTMLAGDIRFVYFSAIWFFVWIILNLELIPGVKAFDPFPFGLLTMVVSLEAIFLSLFVLISQNRQAAREKIRNDIEYEVNLKAELEIRDLQQQIENLQQLMLQHLSALNGAFVTMQQGQRDTQSLNPREG
jgi:uncharacterized membrane protein